MWSAGQVKEIAVDTFKKFDTVKLGRMQIETGGCACSWQSEE